MSADLLAQLYTALKTEPGLTATGLSKRIDAHPHEIRHALLEIEQGGYVRVEIGEMEPGDTGRPRRYWLV